MTIAREHALTTPLIEEWPPVYEATGDGETMHFRVIQQMRVVSLAGLMPLVTCPGHDEPGDSYPGRVATGGLSERLYRQLASQRSLILVRHTHIV
jgi:hypothetical protein